MLTFFFKYSAPHRNLHSFLTRRSSDLKDLAKASQQGQFRDDLLFRLNVLPIHIPPLDRKSTRLNSSHPSISYAVFCLKKKTVTKAEETEVAPEHAGLWAARRSCCPLLC